MSNQDDDKPAKDGKAPLPDGWSKLSEADFSERPKEESWETRAFRFIGAFLFWSFVVIALLFGTCFLLVATN